MLIVMDSGTFAKRFDPISFINFFAKLSRFQLYSSKMAPNSLMYPTLFKFAGSRDLAYAVTNSVNSNKINRTFASYKFLLELKFCKTNSKIIKDASFILDLLKHISF